MELEIIKDAHEEGHFNEQKTAHIVKQQFFIPHVERKVATVIRNCVRCIIHNKKVGKKEGFLQVIDKGDTPLHTLHIDHLGPMDSTAKQYKYILDETIAKLQIWMYTFGYPQRIISDRGPCFTSKLFADFCKEGNVEHVLVTTGVPRGNGQIERANRTILSVISKLSSEDPTKWFKNVGQVQKAMNVHVHSSLNISPFEVMFGVKMKSNIHNSITEVLQQEFIQRFDEERQQLRAQAKQQLLKVQEQQKQQHDKKCKVATDYVVGDLVAIKRTQFISGKKLASQYLGPYKVVKVKRNNRYEVTKYGNFEGPNKT